LGIGFGTKVKLPGPEAVPPAVVIDTAPVAAPGITIANKVLPSLLITIEETPPIFTAVAFCKFVPVIVTSVPIDPLLGEKLVIVGCAISTDPVNKEKNIITNLITIEI
jgi:hypothetical protein